MPCECKSPFDHVKKCGRDDDVSADAFMEKYTDAELDWKWSDRPKDSKLPGSPGNWFRTNMIGYLVSESYTALRLEKVKCLATKHPHLLDGGKHPPVMLALDRMLYTSGGVARDAAHNSGAKWLQELVALGASVPESTKQLVALVVKHENDLKALKETHKKDVEAHMKVSQLDKADEVKNLEKSLSEANAVSIPTLMQLKAEAQAHVTALQKMTVEGCYGPLIEAVEQQIRESRRVAMKAHQLDQHTQDITARVEAVRKDLAAVSAVGTDVTERDEIRNKLARCFPSLKTNVGTLLSLTEVVGDTTMEECSERNFLTDFVSHFNAARQRWMDPLQKSIDSSNALFDSLSSSTDPPEDLSGISANLRSALQNCSPIAFRAETDRLCPRAALADLGEETALLQEKLDQSAEALRTEVDGMEASFRQHVEQPLRFAATSKEAGMKVNELLEASDEAEDARNAFNKAVKSRHRLRSAISAEEKVAEATAQKQQAIRAYRAKAVLYVGPLLRHFPEYRQALTEGLQLPTVVTAADSPMDPLLTLEDFTLEGHVTDEVMLATLKTGGSSTKSRKRQRDDCDVPDTTDGQKCVLKRFSDEVRLMRELTAMRRVQHPFVATASGAFYDRDYYLWMPRYEGGTLTEWLQLHQNDAEAVLRVLYQMASGLSAVHTAGVIHCDMKPANVMMTSNSVGAHPCLIDFDFAAPDGNQADGTMGLALLRIGRTMVLGGTRRYLAPEMCDATVTAAECTSAVDAYALGVVLWVDVLGSDAQVVIDALEYPDAADCSACAETLRPHKDVLMPLITRLMVQDPSERCTVAEAEGVLRGLWERVRGEQHDHVVAAQRPVECVTCGGQRAARQAAECRGGHGYCGECALNLVGAQREAGDWMEHYRKGGVRCSVTGCAELVPLESLEAVKTEEGARVLRQMTEDVAAAEAVATYKRQQESQSAVQKALRELDETVLNLLRCPSSTCGKLVHIVFKDCMSLQCPHCRTIFCAWCSAIQTSRNEGHRHVHNCHENAAPRRGLYCHDPDVWYRHWEGRRRAAVERYLKDLPEEVAAAVRPLVLNANS